jgi:cytochrome P450
MIDIKRVAKRQTTRDGVHNEDLDLNQIEPRGAHWRRLDELQRDHPWFWTTYRYGHWVLTDPVAIREAFQQPDLFSSVSEVAAEPDPGYTWIPSNLDPPEHVKYRQLLNAWFSPQAVQRLADDADAFARLLIGRFRDRGSCDFMAEFASAFPAAVFLYSLGLPVDDTDAFECWVREIFDNLRDPELRAPLEKAMGQVRRYFADVIADRRRSPRDPSRDFVSHLVNSSVDGEPLSDDDILNICVVMLMAGVETTTGQLGFMFQYLAENADARGRIIEEPEIIPSAVEEFLRAHPIVLPGRKVTRDAEFHGCPMKQGDMVMLTIPCANRSPEMFPNPTELDFERAPNRHVAFGSGPHRCLGIHLARRELATALSVWHELIPDYRIATDEPLMERGGQIGLVSLPLAWD